MKKIPWDAAQTIAHELVKVDHEKVVKMLTLRAAQVKYVLNRSTLLEDETLASVRKKLLPPVSGGGDALIQYSLAMHETFMATIRPLLERSTSARENEKWKNELEETLLEMRRIVMQNLSKHPALRPYNLLIKLNEQMQKKETQNNVHSILIQKKSHLERNMLLAQKESEECKTLPGFDTLRRLDESLETLVAEKRALNEHWMNCWAPLSDIFKRLAENEAAAEKWENAQHRMLHLYLTNPSLTRDRDTHGQGLVMILRLAVSALETRKKMFKGMNNEDVRTTLLNALENPLFVHFQEHLHALDAAIASNQNERAIHPHHRILAGIQKQLADYQMEYEKIDEDIFKIIQEKESLSKEIQSVWKEANHACQTQLNFELENVF